MHRPTLSSLGAILGVGLLAPLASEAATPPVPVHALVADKAPLRLAPPEQVESASVRTKAGTEIAAKVYRPGKWYWPETEAAKLTMTRDKSGAIAATGEVVMIVFDAGDGVSHMPIVEMFLAMGATVVAFDNPIVGQRDRALDERAEQASDVVHAMVTWTAKQVASEGRLNLYAAGPRASALALDVGATRTANLWSVMVDGADAKFLAKLAPRFAEAAPGFEGLLVVGGTDKSVAALEPAKSQAYVQIDGASLDRAGSVEALVGVSEYQRTLAMFLNSDVILPPKDCLVCGLTRTAKRTVLRLDH